MYVSVLGDKPTRTATLDGLQSAHGFLQGRIAAELSLKHTPALLFEYDESVDRGMRISELARQLRRRTMAENGRRSSREQVLEELGRAEKLIAVTHENPDGDALGRSSR